MIQFALPRQRRYRAFVRTPAAGFFASMLTAGSRVAVKTLLTVTLAGTLAACGGGDSTRNDPPPNNPPADPPADPPSAAVTMNEASRFAARATFGLPYGKIESLSRQGYEAWLDTQFALPPSRHRDIVANLLQRRAAGEFADVEEDIELLIQFRRYAWWHRTVTAPDELRQRVAFALSEIFVVSDNVDVLAVRPFALSGYYDMLLDNAFGNFRDLLRDVTLHPAMGIYLSHVNNRKTNPTANTFPDENYAREVMQLFSIGLFELNADGSPRIGTDDRPIPTYDNHDIREFAKVFTGLSYGGSFAYFGNPEPNFLVPMQMFAAEHESGEKRLLNGFVVAAGQPATQDLEDAIDNLFNHPNVGPFIGRQLIQRLVTSNPSPAYVGRVAAAFDGDQTGVRGDMQAVVRAVLLDEEALAEPGSSANFGKLREPLIRYVSMMRQLNAASSDRFVFNGGYFLSALINQHALSSPSVFNFFLPDHSPAGAIADAGLVAPEFQITTTTTVVGMTNAIDIAVNGGFVVDAQAPFGEVTLDLDEFTARAFDIDALLDRLDQVFTYGTLSDATRIAIADVLADIPDARFRAQTAIYLILISPDYAVQV